jgi:hypothetical protein
MDNIIDNGMGNIMTEDVWNYIQHYNVEHWEILYENLGLEYYKLEIDKDLKKQILTIYNQKSDQPCTYLLQKKIQTLISKSCQDKGWFIRLSTKSIRDVFPNMIISPLNTAEEIVDMLLCSKIAYSDLWYSLYYDTEIALYIIEWRTICMHYEFRVFWHNSKITAITQYNCQTDLIFDDEELCKIIPEIKKLEMVNSLYKDGALDISVYTRNSYNATSNIKSLKYIIEPLDWNPYHETTASILFNWNEIHTCNFTYILCRYIRNGNLIQIIINNIY